MLRWACEGKMREGNLGPSVLDLRLLEISNFEMIFFFFNYMQCETRGRKTLYHKNIWGKTLLEENFLASPRVLQPKALPSHG